MSDTPRDYSTANLMLLCGSVSAALAMHSEILGPCELEVDGDGDYTGRTIIRRPSGPWAVSVSPAPEVPDA